MDRLRHDFKKQDLLPDPRKCFQCGRPYEWAPKPKTFGWFELLAVCGVFLFFGMAFEKWEMTNHRYAAEGVKVVKRFDDYRYLMTFPQPTNFKPWPKTGTYEVWFCHTIKPCIPEGTVLTSLRWRSSADCWDVEPLGLGYNFLQDEKGNDIDETGRIVFDAEKDSCQ